MRVLVTGGTGYLGSHAVVALLAEGHAVSVVDNLSNSKPGVVPRLRALAGRAFPVHVLDLRDASAVDALFARNRFDAVLHFAALKSVAESTREPLLYYENNLGAATTVLDAMRRHDVRIFVFSSSATVYGAQTVPPVAETAPLSATNPYGSTKVMIEQMLRDVAAADDGWRIAVLRYFNPVGAHPSGSIGEDPRGEPDNLMPALAQVACGRRPYLHVFGDDYPTPDGTALRDYIHVEDLVAGHLAALDVIASGPWALRVWNLGTGRPVSVLELVRAFEAIVGRELPFRIGPRRAGDVASMYADPSRAANELRWHAVRSVSEMCADAWRWQAANPDGYAAGQ